MICRISTWRITWRFLLVFLVLFVVAFLSATTLFFNFDLENGIMYPKEWGVGQTVFLVVFAVLFVATYIPTIRCFYYVIEDKYFLQKRIGKDLEFTYANIDFIDIEESKRKNMIIFHTAKAPTKYMLGDKDGKVLETLIKKCPNTMSVEEFRRRHPEERY